jgi:hypothetical protein
LDATNSFGAYVASVAMVSVPLDLIFAGTAAAILLSVVIVDVPLVEVVLVVAEVVVLADFFLLPPQPAARTTIKASTAKPARDRSFGRCIFSPFVCGNLGTASQLTKSA